MDATTELQIEIETVRQREGIKKYLKFRRWLREYKPALKKAASDLTRTPINERNGKFAQVRAACEGKNPAVPDAAWTFLTDRAKEVRP